MANPIPIPSPPGLPFLGNIGGIDPGDMLNSLSHLTDKYGEIFKLSVVGNDRIFLSSYSLINEVFDETRFTKAVSAGLKEMRHAIGDGLFTAYYGEHNWEVAHRVLMPAFGPLSIRSMFDEMHDIASQLVIKWARFGSTEKINVTSDFTRLTLDSIALCAMDTRFNSFYKEQMHPFVDAMVGVLSESGARAQRPAFATYLMRSTQHKYDADIALLKNVAGEAIAERQAHPSDKKDLLNAMLKGRDPKTGERMTEQSIMNNMITFLIAGHETTSGLLSFQFYHLLKNPAAYQAAQREVDEVVGRGPVTVEHMSQLPYLTACLRETLRLTPSVISNSLEPLPTTREWPVLLGGGKYEVQKGQSLVALNFKMHRDPTIYGEDADNFRPERMLDEAFAKLPPNAWKPFGNGIRACIGRPFAWQEALLTTALLLQNFDFHLDDPSYELQMQQTLTVKPKGFFMHATVRDHIDLVHLEKLLHIDISKASKMSNNDHRIAESAVANGKSKQPMTILYGSNSGTCESLAQNLARVARSRGFEARVDMLDAAVRKVPKEGPVVMISSTYEGRPPDNAAHFITWLGSLEGDDWFAGVKYAVFAVGNHDWASTFHKVPKVLDTSFAAHGATRIAKMGLADVAAGDIFNDFDRWQDEILWPAIGGGQNNAQDESGPEVEIDTTSRRSNLRQDVKEAIVISNQVLTAEGVPEKRHIVLQLPTGMTYKAGDYLAVLPINNRKYIHRVLKRFGLPWDAMLNIKSGANTTLPTGHPMSAISILGAYVELSQLATRKNIQRISLSIDDQTKREKLRSLAGEEYDTKVAAKRRSPLDILEEYPEAALPLGDFLAMLPPMRIRQYSISSSPLADPTIASITWSVLDTPSKVAGGKRFLGVASNYLSNVEEADRVHVAVKPSHGFFHPPSDIEHTPVIMICAGTGIAPFRGFVQERAMQIQAGRKLAPAYLFVGCAHPEQDRLFWDEFSRWQDEGAVTLYYAHSAAKDLSKGARYVQDRLWEEREEMRNVFAQGAKIYICGSSLVGDGVAATVKRIYREAGEAAGTPKTDEEAEAWFEGIKSDRYALDVFA